MPNFNFPACFKAEILSLYPKNLNDSYTSLNLGNINKLCL